MVSGNSRKKISRSGAQPGGDEERLRELRREIHGLLKDARTVIAEVEAATARGEAYAAKVGAEVHRSVQEVVTEMLTAYTEKVLTPMLHTVSDEMAGVVDRMRVRLIGEAEQSIADAMGAPSFDALAETVNKAMMSPDALRARVMRRRIDLGPPPGGAGEVGLPE